MSYKSRLAALVCTTALVSCTGSIADTLPSDDGPEVGGTGGRPGTLNPSSGPPSPDTGLWRLTRTEFNNTLRDLLGETRRLGDRLDLDPTPAGFGFDKNATLLASVPPDPDKYDAIATDAVENAFRAGS